MVKPLLVVKFITFLENEEELTKEKMIEMSIYSILIIFVDKFNIVVGNQLNMYQEKLGSVACNSIKTIMFEKNLRR